MAQRECCFDHSSGATWNPGCFGSENRHYGERWLVEQEAGDVYVAVAELDGNAVGRCGLNFVWHAFTAGMVDLWAAFVADEARSQGVGTALFTISKRKRSAAAIRRSGSEWRRQILPPDGAKRRQAHQHHR